MARYAHIRNSFLMGEVSPTAWGRTDLPSYTQACERLQNFIVRPIGGAYKRKGSLMAFSSASNSSLQSVSGLGNVRTIQFGAFVVVFGDDFLKYYSAAGGSAYLFTLSDINRFTGATGSYTANFIVNTDLSKLQYAISGNTMVVTSGLGNVLIIVNDGGTLKYIVWGEGFLSVNSAGVLGYTSDQQHRLYPYFTENTSATTITASANTGAVTLTASTGIFAPTMTSTQGKAGVYVRIRSGSTCAVAEITAYTSPTVVTAQTLTAGGFATTGLGPHTAWSFSAWNQYFGFPTGVAFFQNRLYFCGSANGTKSDFKDYIWASQLGDIFEFSKNDPTTADANTDAFYFPATAGGSVQAQWICPSNGRLFCGLEDQLVYLKETDSDVALGLTNTTIKYANANGAAPRQPIVADNALIYVDANGKLREVVYNQQEDTFQSLDLSSFTEDIAINRRISAVQEFVPSPEFRELHYSRDLGVIFMIDDTGALYTCTRSRPQGTLAWSYHRLGGSYAGNADGHVQVLSLAYVPRAYGVSSEELIWMVVRRTIGATTKITLEMLPCVSNVRVDTLADDVSSYGNVPNYMDCCITGVDWTLSGAQVSLGSNFASATVSAFGDGNYLGEFTANGSGVLPTTLVPANYDVLTFGFVFTAQLVPVALESNSLFGTGIGQIKRTEEVAILLNKTVHLEFGELNNEDDLQEVQFRESTVVASDPIPLFTGEKVFKMRSNYTRRQNVMLQSSKPYPCDVVAIVAKGVLYD